MGRSSRRVMPAPACIALPPSAKTAPAHMFPGAPTAAEFSYAVKCHVCEAWGIKSTSVQRYLDGIALPSEIAKRGAEEAARQAEQEALTRRPRRRPSSVSCEVMVAE